MGNLLFSQQGLIGRDAFHKGAVILLAVNFFMWPAWYLGLGIGVLAAIASFILIYCWACLFVKRLRSAGKPGIWFLAIFSAFLFGTYIVGSIFLSALFPDMVQEMATFLETTDRKNPDLEKVWPFYEKLLKSLAIPYAAAYLIVGYALASLINKNLPVDHT